VNIDLKRSIQKRTTKKTSVISLGIDGETVREIASKTMNLF
jgi:hypothetical protein